VTPDSERRDGWPARVVIRSPNWLGDAVMALPALRDLRRHFGSSTLAVATPRNLAPFYGLVPGVDEVLPLAGGRGRAADVAALRSRGFDLAVLLTNSFNSAWMMSRAGVPERWGYRADFRGLLLTRGVRRQRRRGAVHHATYYQDLVRGLGMEAGPLEARVEAPAGARERARRLLLERGLDPARVPIAGIAPGAAYGGAKRWPPDRVADLVRALVADAGVACVLFGSAGDVPAARAVESSLGGLPGMAGLAPGGPARAVDLVGRTDLETMIGLLRWCDAFVSNDSGAMHLAAAAGVPVTALFGPTDERATAPLGRHAVLAHPVWCRPCHLRECPIDHRCMKGLSVQMVLASVTAHLAAARPEISTAAAAPPREAIAGPTGVRLA
jgi:heptosyltransferase-2